MSPSIVKYRTLAIVFLIFFTISCSSGDSSKMALIIEEDRAIADGEVIQELLLTPQIGRIEPGESTPITITGVDSNGTVTDLTNQVTLSTSDSAVATIVSGGANAGLLTGVSADSTDVTVIATYTQFTTPIRSETTVSVSDEPIESITLAPLSTNTNQVCEELGFTATANYRDSRSFEITAVADWSSSPEETSAAGNLGATKGKFGGSDAATVYTLTVNYKGVSANTDINLTGLGDDASLTLAKLESDGTIDDSNVNYDPDEGTIALVALLSLSTEDDPVVINPYANFEMTEDSQALATISALGEFTSQDGVTQASATVSVSCGGISDELNITIDDEDFELVIEDENGNAEAVTYNQGEEVTLSLIEIETEDGEVVERNEVVATTWQIADSRDEDFIDGNIDIEDSGFDAVFTLADDETGEFEIEAIYNNESYTFRITVQEEGAGDGT